LPNRKNILVISGLDPSGGAGISADIETIHSLNFRALPIITTLTSQNTQTVSLSSPVDIKIIDSQLKSLIEDIKFDGIKLGLLADKTIMEYLSDFLDQHKNIPIVVDPILKSSSGNVFVYEKYSSVYLDDLIPKATIATPNREEFLKLTRSNKISDGLKNFCSKYTLITSSVETEDRLTHQLFNGERLLKEFHFEKLPNIYHGSGCTLASAIACFILEEKDIIRACGAALDYTYQTLLNAEKVGKMQFHPNRI
jgi:hydroxymethylpyrimidine/phosphomethylpyrimidine kinase